MKEARALITDVMKEVYLSADGVKMMNTQYGMELYPLNYRYRLKIPFGVISKTTQNSRLVFLTTEDYSFNCAPDIIQLYTQSLPLLNGYFGGNVQEVYLTDMLKNRGNITI